MRRDEIHAGSSCTDYRKQYGTDSWNAEQKRIHLLTPVLGMGSDDQEERGPHSTRVFCELHFWRPMWVVRFLFGQVGKKI